jgi:antitoxin component YwqK of YwqJK toxin-antitoxin module
MKRSILLLFLLLFTVVGNTQKISYVNGTYVDERGASFTGTYTQKYESGITKAEFNGNKRMEMQYTNGEKTGTWKMWNETGLLISERKYTVGS